MASFTRTAGQDLIDQNRGSNMPYGAYIEYCDKNDDFNKAVDLRSVVHKYPHIVSFS